MAVALTLLGHAHFEALLQPAVLAAVPGHLVDDAVLVPVTCVHHVLLDAAAEEALGTEGREPGQLHPQIGYTAGPATVPTPLVVTYLSRPGKMGERSTHRTSPEESQYLGFSTHTHRPSFLPPDK